MSDRPYSKLNLPVYHETMDIIDSTKLNTFQDCPREFFYRYVLGWQEVKPNIHLTFGSAWHEAMEYLYRCQDGDQVGYTAEQVVAAFRAFAKSYEKNYPSDIFSGLEELAGYDTTAGAKDKANAGEALIGYVSRWKDDNFKTLYAEIAGSIAISDTRDLHFNMDSVIDNGGMIGTDEHKTTGRLTQTWRNQWATRLQVGGYSHVLYTLFGDGNSGVRINGAVLRKPYKDGRSNNEFLRIPVKLSRDMMATWLWEVQHLLSRLDWNMEQFAKAKASDRVLQCFPRNPASCAKYGCKFEGLCSTWANPLKYADNPPEGFKRGYWDPRLREVIDPEAPKPRKKKLTAKQETIDESGVVAIARKV